MTTDDLPIGLIGAGGHAKVVVDIIERAGLGRVVGLYDDNAAKMPSHVFDIPLRGTRDTLLEDHTSGRVRAVIVAIGNNAVRAHIAAWCDDHGIERATAVHPTAAIGRGVHIGRGTVVMAGAVVNADSRIGDDVIVNTRASVDHDGDIGHGVHLAPGSTLCGRVVVGDGTFVCAGATIVPNRTIGAGVTVGAGATVLRDVADGLTVVGTPARPLHGVES